MKRPFNDFLTYRMVLILVVSILVSVVGLYHRPNLPIREIQTTAIPSGRDLSKHAESRIQANPRNQKKNQGARDISNDSNINSALKALDGLALGSEERDFLILEIARTLGSDDPVQGFAWLKSLGEFKEGMRAHRAFASSFASSRPENWLHSIPIDTTEACRQEFIGGALIGVAGVNPYKALDQANNLLREGKIRSITKDATINSILMQDEHSGWSIIANSDGKSELSKDEVTRFFSFIHYKDPHCSVEKILSIGDQSLRNLAWEKASRNAPLEAIREMGEALSAKPNGESTSVGLANLAERYYQIDPLKAAEWCSKIEDKELHESVKESILRYASNMTITTAKSIVEKLDH